MTYYDDEEENGQQQPRPAQRPGQRGEFRADPSFSPRAGYHQPPPDDDAYAQPQPGQPQAEPDAYADPAAPGYRQSAPPPPPDPYGADPQQQAYGGYAQGPSAQQAQDAYYQDYEQQHYGQHSQGEPPRRRNLVNIGVFAGAILVFGGIIFYAYNQGMRAGTESVAPILRADENPTKIRPDQPGGMQVPHQDKLIYDRLNPSGNRAPGEVERLLPPPEAPMERPRAQEAYPPEQAMPMAEEGESQVANAPPSEPEPTPAPVPQPAPTYAPPQTAPQQQPAQRPPAPAPQPAQQQASGAPVPLTPQATAPAPRPVAPPPAAAAPAPAPRPAATGSVRVQVAAVDSEAKATAEWQRLQKKFPAELGSLPMRTTRVELPRGTFFRIQAGPMEEAQARQICAALSAQGAGCSLVR
ncbi:SPOR domain-containing protein [Niveispirillum fermenti]|uniref:SPOR domain-containing protein n=1 Tax=Niveispirillum fermenti TaxID=1233113 RepID=UPI003A8C07BD